jgi:arylsulfatase A-like enzyme
MPASSMSRPRARRAYNRSTMTRPTTVSASRLAACSLALAASWLPAAVTAQQAPTPRPAARPNIVLIFLDDLGYGDIAPNGAIGTPTPAIDRLAAEGMRFTQFYAAQAVCSASRAALLTGAYSNRVGITGALFPGDKKGLPGSEETLAELLRAAGYRTGMVGKWHLGDHEPFLPLQHGFDEYLGLPYSNDMWSLGYDGKPVTDPASWKSHAPPLPLIEDNRVLREIRTPADQDTLTTTYTERARRFILEAKQPFFLYLAHSMPHVPLGVSDRFRGKSPAGRYGDVVMELDWSVGQVLGALDEKGVSDWTIVIFTSDNGPWLSYGNHAGSSGGLREGKGTAWEGGVREPAIVRWPGVVPAGSICSKMATTMDLLPTLVAATGAPKPRLPIDGVDLAPLLRGDASAEPRDEFAYYYGHGLRAVRKGQWKLVLPHTSQTYKAVPPGQDGRPAQGPDVSVPLALYDLRADPGETLDVQSAHPDIVERLTAIADRYRHDLGDDLTGVKGTGVR